MRYLIMSRVGRSIVLIGMMGSGKSSVGRCLHRMTGLALLQTDEMVASNFKMPIPEIFAKHGEKKFRAAETEMLRTLSTAKRTVIATGGGIVLQKANVEILKRVGVIVWLDGNEETLFKRALERTDRPLLQTKNPRRTFSEILGARTPLYAKIADIRIDTSDFTDEEVAVAILTRLRMVNRKSRFAPTIK